MRSRSLFQFHSTGGLLLAVFVTTVGLVAQMILPVRPATAGVERVSSVQLAKLQATPGAVVLSISPGTSTVSVGQGLTVTVEVQASTEQLDGAAAYLNFDPARLQTVGLTSGTSLPIVLQETYDNTAGHVDFAAGTLTPPYASGTFTLVTVAFIAVGTTTNTALTFNATEPRNSDATFGGASVFGGTSGGTVVVQLATATPTPTPSNTPTPSSTPTITPTPTATPILVTGTINPSTGGNLSKSDGSVEISFPAHAVSAQTIVTYHEYSAPNQVLPNGGKFLLSFSLEARTSGGQVVTRFQQPFTLSLAYTDAALAAKGIKESNLNVAYWNGTLWVNVLPCTGCGVDTLNKRVIVVADHFTEFVLGSIPNTLYLPLIVR